MACNKRFVRRTNVGSIEENWDDETLLGRCGSVGIGCKFLQINLREPTEATFGSKELQASALEFLSFDTEALDNEYEATPMGERVASCTTHFQQIFC